MLTLQCRCGEVYHAEERYIGSSILCRRCGKILPVKPILLPTRPFTAIPSLFLRLKPRASIYRGRFTQQRAGVWIIGLVLLGLLAYRLLEPKEHQKPQIEPAEPLNPHSLPLGASPLGKAITYGSARLRVENGTDTDALVLVAQVQGSEQKIIQNFYIPQNISYTPLPIPSGQYVLRAAFGRDWDESAKRFNFRCSFTQTGSFYIGEDTVMEITLRDSPLGNLNHQKISEREFYK